MRRPRRSGDYKEFSLVEKLSKSERRFRDVKGNDIALIFPSTYRVAASSLAYFLVRDILYDHGLKTERFFFHKEFKKFYSVESLRPLDEFKIWAFSYHFELDIINILEILERKGIPLLSVERNPNHPKVLIGGSVTYFNHKFLTVIADYVYRGDLEPYAKELSEFLKGEDVEVPPLCTNERMNCILAKFDDINNRPPVSSVVAPEGEFKGKLLIEIGRGCIRRCAFCNIGYVKKPARFLKPEVLMKILEEIPENVPLGLISATVTDYPWLDELVRILNHRKVSFSSMRMDGINEELLILLKNSGQRSFTVAPEGGSQKIRDVLMKDISEKDIENALKIARDVGFENLKMYFIYGVEEETEEDLRSIVELCKYAEKMGFLVKASLNPLIPKPGTFFENRKIQSADVLKEKEKFLKKLFAKEKIKADFESIKECIAQYKIARAKRDDTLEFVRVFKKHGRNGLYKFLTRC